MISYMPSCSHCNMQPEVRGHRILRGPGSCQFVGSSHVHCLLVGRHGHAEPTLISAPMERTLFKPQGLRALGCICLVGECQSPEPWLPPAPDSWSGSHQSARWRYLVRKGRIISPLPSPQNQFPPCGDGLLLLCIYYVPGSHTMCI